MQLKRPLDVGQDTNRAPDPVRAWLRQYPRIKGLVIGAYGEASMVVHPLLRSTVAHLAMRELHKMGVRNECEALGHCLTRLHRRRASAAVLS